jgi:hypothetical protein
MALLGGFTFKRCGGIRGPYDWTLPNIVDDDGALRSAFLAKTIRLIGCWIGRAGCHLAGT